MDQPHRRYDPLSDKWILLSPHRLSRPWQGEEGEDGAVEYLEDEGEDGFGTGMTESAAIVDYCNKYGLKRPFWWT